MQSSEKKNAGGTRSVKVAFSKRLGLSEEHKGHRGPKLSEQRGRKKNVWDEAEPN